MLACSVRYVLSFLLVLTLTACGGGGGGGGGGGSENPPPPPPVSRTVQGAVAKGPVNGATVIAYRADGVTEIARAGAPTTTDGRFKIDLGSYSGVVILIASGGTYIDEATGENRPLSIMRSAIDYSGGDINAQITPLTEMAVRLMEDAGGINATNIQAFNRFQFTDGTSLDVIGVSPDDLRTTAFDNDSMASRYGLLLALISQMQTLSPDLREWGAVVDALRSDLVDGELDQMAVPIRLAMLMMRNGTGPLAGNVPADAMGNLLALMPLPASEGGENHHISRFGGAAIDLVRAVKEMYQATSGSPAGGPWLQWDDSDSESGNCAQGGTYQVVITRDGHNIVETYEQCTEWDGVLLHGSRTLAFDEADAGAGFSVTRSFNNFSITEGGVATRFDGSLSIALAQGFLDPLFVNNVQANFSVTNALFGTLSYRGVSLGFRGGVDFLNNLEGITGFAGSINIGRFGQATLGFDPVEGTILLTPAAGGYGTLKLQGGRADLFYHASGNAPASAALRMRIGAGTHPYEEYDFYSLQVWQPFIRTTYQPAAVIVQRETVDLDVLENFGDLNGDVLTFSLEVVGVEQGNGYSAGNDRPIALDDPRLNYSLTRTGVASFRFSSNTPGDRLVYRFHARATEAAGSSTDPVSFTVTVFGDFDGDGILDRDDSDDDNDGVLDWEDDLPYDSTESVDTDKDGIGNNADTDDDNDGVPDVDDFYPLNRFCSAEEEGDGSRCYIEVVAQDYTRAFMDNAGVVHFWHSGNPTVPRWDANAERFLAPLQLAPNAGDQMGSLVYAPVLNRLYVQYSSGDLTFIDLSSNDDLQEQPYVVGNPSSLYSAAVVDGRYLTISESVFGPFSRTQRLYDEQGVELDQFTETGIAELGYVDPDFAFLWPRGITLNRADGQLFSFSGGPESTSFGHVLSPDGSHVLTWPDGRVVSVATEDDVAKVELFEHTLWEDDIVTYGSVFYRNRWNHVLRRYDDQYRAAEFVTFDTPIEHLFRLGGSYLIITRETSDDGQTIAFRTYTPSDDTDGDGVDNREDRFPNDPAASVDSDGDGAPDTWNPGRSAADSTQGLVLDAYPGRSGCWLQEHSVNGACDPGATAPGSIYAAVKSVVDENGVVYVHIPERQWIYRWSSRDERYLDPLPVGGHDHLSLYQQSPVDIVYAASSQRLYFVYPQIDIGHRITYASLTQPFQEHAFAEVETPYSRIIATERGVVVSRWSNIMDVLNDAGVVTATRTGVDSIREMAETTTWNSATQRLFTISDTVGPVGSWGYTLYSRPLDQSGQFGAGWQIDLASPLGLDEHLPMAIDRPGQRLALLNGLVYRINDGALLANLGQGFAQQWASNGHLYRIAGGAYALEEYDANLSLIATTHLEPANSRTLFEVDGHMVALGVDQNRRLLFIKLPLR